MSPIVVALVVSWCQADVTQSYNPNTRESITRALTRANFNVSSSGLEAEMMGPLAED